MKNKKSILVGLFFAIISVLFFNGIIQYLIFYLADIEVGEFQFTISGLTPITTLPLDLNIYLKSLFIIIPVLINIFFIELLFLLLGKTSSGFMRYSTIVFLILLSGYLIISVFYGLIELILSSSSSSIWERIIELWQLEGNQVFAFVFFVILVLFGYLQIMQKRLMQYLIVSKPE